MEASRWQAVRALYHGALELSDTERELFLHRACEGDEELRSEVASLLAVAGRVGEFLESPAWDRPEDMVADDAAPRHSPDHQAGTCVGDYELKGLLGIGGMGVVYEAEQRTLRRTVALKLIRPDMATPSMIARFEYEAQLVGRLQHPGIAQIFEAGVHRSASGAAPNPFDPVATEQPFFAMERIIGEPITDFARSHDLDRESRLELFSQVCDAVEHAHQRGVIHRDLKPANILVVEERHSADSPPSHATPASMNADGRFQPKILDFGVARAIDVDGRNTAQRTEAGQLLGTLPYMSPEQVGGDPNSVDTRSDVYALGVLAYELLTDRLPLDVRGKSIPDAARMLRDDTPTPLSAIDPKLDGDLSVIVGKALAKEKERRYSSCSELAADVQRFIQDEPILARPPSARYQISKLIARHRAPFAFAVVLIAVLMSATAVSLWQAALFVDQRNVARAAERNETEQRQTAEQVADFLERLFETVDPDERNRANPKVEEILQAGIQQLGTELHEQPLVRARLLTIVGRINRRLRDFGNAEQWIEEGRDLRIHVLGDDHPLVAESLAALADVHAGTDRRESALALYEQSLQLRQDHYGSHHELVAESWAALGSCHFYRDDFPAAAEAFREAIRISTRLEGSRSRKVAQRQVELATTLSKMGEHERSLDLLQEALATQREQLGAHFDTVATLNALAHALRGRGDPASYEAVLREQVALSRDIFHPTHPRIGAALHDLAFSVRRHNLAEAETLYREALDIVRDAWGEQHPTYARTAHDLGTLLQRQLRFEEAIDLLTTAVRIDTSEFGSDAASTLNKRNGLAAALLAAGQAEVAIRQFEAILAARRQQAGRGGVPGSRSVMTGIAHQNLGAAFAEAGRPAEAREHFEAAADIYRERESPTLGAALGLLGQLHSAAADFAGAEALLQQGVEIRLTAQRALRDVRLTQAQLGAARIELEDFLAAEEPLVQALEALREMENPPAVHLAWTLSVLATLREDEGDHQRAVELANEAATLAREGIAPHALSRAEVLARRGTILVSERPAIAEPDLAEALQILRDSPFQWPWRVAQVQSMLGICLLHRGEREQAEALLRKGLATLEQTHGPDHWRTIAAAEGLQAAITGPAANDNR